MLKHPQRLICLRWQSKKTREIRYEELPLRGRLSVRCCQWSIFMLFSCTSPPLPPTPFSPSSLAFARDRLSRRGGQGVRCQKKVELPLRGRLSIRCCQWSIFMLFSCTSPPLPPTPFSPSPLRRGGQGVRCQKKVELPLRGRLSVRCCQWSIFMLFSCTSPPLPPTPFSPSSLAFARDRLSRRGGQGVRCQKKVELPLRGRLSIRCYQISQPKPGFSQSLSSVNLL